MKRNFSLIILLLIAIILFWGNENQRIKKANFLSKTLYYPFVNSVHRLDEIFRVNERNKFLAAELAKEVLKNNLLENKLQKFKQFGLSFPIHSYNFVLAEIIAYSGSFKDKNLIINKGKTSGIEPDNPVISNNGIVGKIISVSPNYAVIMPFNHSDFKLGVMLKRNNVQGILASDENGKTYVTMLDRGSEINIGDTIVTSNISGIFPPRFPVGTVSKI
ncbi:MAG: hypothetical protein DRZ79_03265, partial [Candidatus Cloacimonadota bacterium]